MKFRKKTVVIEAMQYTAENCRAIHKWAGLGEHGESNNGPGYYCGGTSIFIPTLEGNIEAKPGDWIIKDIKGEFYLCKPDIFEASYEPE